MIFSLSFLLSFSQKNLLMWLMIPLRESKQTKKQPGLSLGENKRTSNVIRDLTHEVEFPISLWGWD